MVIDGKQSNEVYALAYAPTTTNEWSVTKLLGVDIPCVFKIDALPQVTCKKVVAHSAYLPKARMWSASVIYHSMWFHFGGARCTEDPYPQIDILDLKSGCWSHLKTAGAGDVPYVSKERWGHSATLIPETGNVYLIGGWDGSCQYNDVYCYNLGTNHMRQLKGEAPFGFRAGHSAIAVGKKIVIYGGAICKGGPYRYYNDVFMLDTETEEWTELKCGSLSQPPTPTAQHTATLFYGRYMLVIGGYDGQWIRNDVYCLDLKLRQWHAVEMKGDLPKVQHLPQTDFRVPAVRQSAFLLPDDVILVYGCDGLYFLDMKSWTWRKVPGEYPALTCHVAVQSEKNQILLFGGCENQKVDNSEILGLTLTYADKDVDMIL